MNVIRTIEFDSFHPWDERSSYFNILFLYEYYFIFLSSRFFFKTTITPFCLLMLGFNWTVIKCVVAEKTYCTWITYWKQITKFTSDVIHLKSFNKPKPSAYFFGKNLIHMLICITMTWKHAENLACLDFRSLKVKPWAQIFGISVGLCVGNRDALNIELMRNCPSTAAGLSGYESKTQTPGLALR